MLGYKQPSACKVFLTSPPPLPRYQKCQKQGHPFPCLQHSFGAVWLIRLFYEPREGLRFAFRATMLIFLFTPGL